MQVPGFRTSKHAGVSVYDLSNPTSPKLVERWEAPGRVEGQDRVGDTLVVTNCDGILCVFFLRVCLLRCHCVGCLKEPCLVAGAHTACG
jgi:hypothetical protein